MGKKAAKKYERLLQQWDVSGNYRKYRDVLKSTAPPCVPYLGLLGKDLWSIEENSKTLLTKSIGARTVVNFKVGRARYLPFFELMRAGRNYASYGRPFHLWKRCNSTNIQISKRANRCAILRVRS